MINLISILQFSIKTEVIINDFNDFTECQILSNKFEWFLNKYNNNFYCNEYFGIFIIYIIIMCIIYFNFYYLNNSVFRAVNKWINQKMLLENVYCE